MSAIAVRNLADEVRRALQLHAARNGRGSEAEIHGIAEEAVRPAGTNENRLASRSIRSRVWRCRATAFNMRRCCIMHARREEQFPPDVQIAAITKVHGFSVATRGAAPFDAVGVPVINPWTVKALSEPAQQRGARPDDFAAFSLVNVDCRHGRREFAEFRRRCLRMIRQFPIRYFQNSQGAEPFSALPMEFGSSTLSTRSLRNRGTRRTPS
jgi:plasmid stability protein